MIEAPPEKLRRLADLRRRANERAAEQTAALPDPWNCERPDCDGLPHRGHEWEHARGKQQAPDGDWFVWLVMAGRGWGKSVTGAGWLARRASRQPKSTWAIVSPTLKDLRRVCIPAMVTACEAIDPNLIAAHNHSEQVLTLANGAEIQGFTAERPAGPKGRNLAGAWLDEIALWPYPSLWSEGLIPALRIGRPQVVVTSTPRPTELFRTFLDRAKDDTDPLYRLTTGSTFENEANLSTEAVAELKARYVGTRVGRQEIEGEFLEDVEGALWTIAMLDHVLEPPQFERIVVAVDPSVTSGENSDETGIIIAAKGVDGHGYVLGDYTTDRHASVDAWAQAVIRAFDDFHADRIVAEGNQGGDLVTKVIQSVREWAPVKRVSAQVGKRTRAEPVAALYEQGRVHHVGPPGTFTTLEDQLTSWVPGTGTSPDRLDALVWAFTELGISGGGQGAAFLEAWGRMSGPGYRPDVAGLTVGSGMETLMGGHEHFWGPFDICTGCGETRP